MLVLPSAGFQATSMLDELCTLDVFPQRKLTHSLKPPCSMRKTLKTGNKTKVNIDFTGHSEVKKIPLTKISQIKRKKRLTIPAGDHHVSVLLVERQRICRAIVQDVSLAVGGSSDDGGGGSGIFRGGYYCGHRTSSSGSGKRICRPSYLRVCYRRAVLDEIYE